jgi:hypothetical protein
MLVKSRRARELLGGLGGGATRRRLGSRVMHLPQFVEAACICNPKAFAGASDTPRGSLLCRAISRGGDPRNISANQPLRDHQWLPIPSELLNVAHGS